MSVEADLHTWAGHLLPRTQRYSDAHNCRWEGWDTELLWNMREGPATTTTLPVRISRQPSTRKLGEKEDRPNSWAERARGLGTAAKGHPKQWSCWQYPQDQSRERLAGQYPLERADTYRMGGHARGKLAMHQYKPLFLPKWQLTGYHERGSSSHGLRVSFIIYRQLVV